ncbi:ATP-binding protein [Glutamicibacter sp. JL.03c]|uniref:ATP-binding protein n=1 Tax=Glutamicibacter sp. JL.03c TaxID=2984842 RepID=UPI0021F6E449|nr:ATP-binding protein [Glutamicibacter sp. JL.03c]UYQ78208.1 ATP-binding protein [Glutamicibacter sp. JL.03c]
MNIPDIDYSRVRSLGPGGKRDGYEQFICELVAQEPPHADANFASLHGAGGDGGVECYWTLPDGTEHGWQAKYWTHHADVDKSQLDASVRAALTNHPNLTKYTIAIPCDPTGRTSGKGKSLLEKINDSDGWLNNWQTMASDREMTVVFEFEWASNTATRLARLDNSGAQRRYWFDADVLSHQWWMDRLQDATNAASPRYMPELNVNVPASQNIAALCSDDDWWDAVLEQVDELSEVSKRLQHARTDATAADLGTVLDAATAVIQALKNWERARTEGEYRTLGTALTDTIAVVREQEAAETAQMNATHEDWDTPSWRQYQSEYFVRFPAEAVDALRALDGKLETAAKLLISPLGTLANSQVALMTGPAGIGKTYLALDVVDYRLQRGLPSVMMHGRWFNDNDPLTHLRDVLQMPADLTSEETIALLDQSARATGAPTLLVIDALNETRPRSVWRDNLARLVSIITRYPHIRLLLTARTHYVTQVVPPGLSIPRFEHTGFEGVEFEAVSDYATYYGLEPPTSPPIHGEFDNPLYLRLVCEALQSDGRLSLDQANMGLGELAKMVLGHANETISNRVDASVSDQIVHRSMHSLASAIANQDGAPLTRVAAQAELSPIWSANSAEKSLLDGLIAQGLVEEDVIPDSSPYGTDIITIAFERIGHHLIVSDALAQVRDINGIRAQLSGRLGQIIGLGSTIDVGLLEATSVVIAERFGIELTAFAEEIPDIPKRDAAIIAGIAWRSTSSITLDTGSIITNALHRSETFDAGLTMLFRLAARPSHPLNADFLYKFLSSLTMASRDQFLAGWLHTSHGTSGAVDRLIRWASEKPLDAVGAETTRLWVNTLLWATSATDRRVREPATIAAARLLARHPDQAATLLEQFCVVDDEWVVERALSVVYSALLATGSGVDWAAAASVVWEKFFTPTAGLTSNAAVRDAARSILEAAHDRKALSADVTADKFRPPYSSDWPLTWPTEEDIARYDNRDYPKVVYSTTIDDFFVYKLKHELLDRPEIDAAAGARWVVAEIIRLGYRPDLHSGFDGYVLGKYGPGRAKPKWIERIGKKYQWIALNRLIGHLSDHAPKSKKSWEPPAPAVPGPDSSILRQVDPTVTEFEPASDAPRLWVPAYNWNAKNGRTDASWVADDSDLPTIDITSAERDGIPFIVLSGSYTWDLIDDNNKRTHTVWSNLYAHFVSTDDLSIAHGELEKQDLINDLDMSRLPMSYNGYVGEFPFGHHHGETLHVVDYEWTNPLSVPTRPAIWELRGENEYAPGNLETISFDAPAPEFFGATPGALHWNGRNGWTDTSGRLIAVLRHSIDVGQNELLMEKDFLQTWLTTEQKSLIWVENTGKDVYREIGWSTYYPGALVRSQVRTWIPGKDVQTLAPGWQRIPSRND